MGMKEDPSVRLAIYLNTLAELESQSVGGEFSAFQAALFSGDAVRSTTTKQQRDKNAAAIAAHTHKLDWLHQNGYLHARQQKWGDLLNASEDDRLWLYCRTSKTHCGG